MPTLRAVATTVLAALVAAGLPAAPAAAAGPTVIDAHDSHVPTRADDITSSASGTLFTTDVGGDHGRNYLIPAPMTTGSTPVDLGPGEWTSVGPQIRGNRVAIPVDGGGGSAAPVTEVRTCTVSLCPATTTFTAPLGTVYVGNGEDRAIVWNASGSDGVISLVPWAGGAATTYTLPGVSDRPEFAEGDTAGVVVSAGGEQFYIHRATGAVTNVGFGNVVRLTPTYVTWWALAVGPAFDTKVWRALRTSPATAAETTLPGAPSIDTFAATDAGFAYLASNGDAEGTSSLWTAAWDATPAAYARPITTNGLSALQGSTSFVVNDRRAAIPGLYAVAPGALSGALAGLVPIRPAKTLALAASNGRAVYADDMTADNPMFARSVLHGVAGPESSVTPHTYGASVALSGPYTAFTRPGTTAGTTQVVYGRVEGPFTTRAFPESEVGSVGISGRTVYVTNGARGRLIDVVTSAVTDLGRSYVAVFGPYVVTLNYDTGEIRRRNLLTGTSQVVSPAIAGCPVRCVDEERVQLSVWGNEVVYAFQAAAGPPVVAALWSGDTGTTYGLSPLTSGSEPRWYELKYWAGLLLVSHVGGDVKIYDVRGFAPAGETLLDTDAERPLTLDGHVAGWRPNDDLRAVVQDLTEAYKGYAASPRYLGAVAPAGFGPGLGDGTWAPSFLVSQDVEWRLAVRDESGSLVHLTDGTSEYGEIAVKPWDGTAIETGEPAPQGTYTWELTGLSPAGQPLRLADGSGAPITGTVYLSRTPLGTPSLSAPVRSTDVSATTSFPLSWVMPAGVPAGTRFQVYRSANGGAFAAYTSTTAMSVTVSGTPGYTYRYRVRAVDPAGRAGAFSADRATMVPYDAGGTTTGSWTTALGSSFYRGSQRQSATAGSTLTFAATGTRIYVVGTRGPAYGMYSVSVDGGPWVAFDAGRPSTQYRQVLFSRTGLSSGRHTVRIQVAGTRGRPYVGIDGFAFYR